MTGSTGTSGLALDLDPVDIPRREPVGRLVDGDVTRGRPVEVVGIDPGDQSFGVGELDVAVRAVGGRA